MTRTKSQEAQANTGKKQANASLVEKLLARSDLSEWEREFLQSVAHQKKLSVRQQKVFDELVERYLEGKPFIAPRTRAQLSSPASKGGRHEQMKKLVLPLLDAGFTEEAVFVQLRGMYEQDVSNREIRDLIEWTIWKNPQLGLNAGNGNTGSAGVGNANASNAETNKIQQDPGPLRINAGQAIANVEAWSGVHCIPDDPGNPLNGQPWRYDQCDLWHASPWRPLDDWTLDSLPLLAALYNQDEFVNIVTGFSVEELEGGKQKANPLGAGKTMLRDDWLRFIREHGVPQSEAGAWIRPNPVKQVGSGKVGAHCDCDVTSYRLCLLESDDLPLDLQLSLWARLPLPVAAIIDTGGRSAHAWIKLDCDTAEEYTAKVKRIYELLTRFGICQNNKNPSRMSRLPGALRQIGKRDAENTPDEEGAQRLLYLNPEPIEKAIFERKK